MIHLSNSIHQESDDDSDMVLQFLHQGKKTETYFNMVNIHSFCVNQMLNLIR